MKTKFTIMLTAFLMLFCVGAHAQSSLKGDVNGDGFVNETDIKEVVKIITTPSQTENTEGVSVVPGDVTGDGFVTVVDIVSIVNIMKANPVISFSVNLINNTGSDVTLDGKIQFVLGNPDSQGYQLGWTGDFNITEDPIVFSNEPVVIPNGQSMKFEGLTWEDKDSGKGMGGKSPATDEQITASKLPRNVLVFVNDNSEVVMCDNMPTTIVFEGGGVYDVILSSNSEPGPGPVNPEAGNPVINIGVKITNNTDAPVTLDGRLRFVLGNPDHNGNYFGGYTGPYIRTDNIWFSGSEGNPNPITLNPGENRTFTNLSWRDADTGLGLGETSPLSPSYLPVLDDQGGIAYARNILIYTDGRSDVTLCDNLSANTVFQDGSVYDISITSAAGGSTPEPGPGPVNPVNPDAGNPVVNIGVNITNNTGSTITLDGRMRFVLGNPDHNGNYFGGYTGLYIRTDNIWFSSTPVTMAPGETRTYYNLSWRDGDTGLGLGETSPLNAGYFPILDDTGGIAYAGNVLMYTDNRSDLLLCDNLSSSTVFQDGGIYDISISSISGGSAPAPSNPGGNPVISFGVNITNATGSPVQLDGRLRFVLGNPNQDGSWFAGWSGGPYIRTDNIYFSSSPIILGAGETRTFSGLTWRDADSGCGLGGASPLSSSYLPVYADDGSIAYAGNVLMYTGNRSDVTLCRNLSENIVFQEGGVYDILITSHP